MPTSTQPLSVELIREFDRSRSETDKLFTLIRDGHFYDRPVPLRHRLIFYLGHLEAFDWNQIARWGLQEPALHPTFDKLFEFGIDPDSTDEPSDQPRDWPSLGEVKDYNSRVRERLDRLLPHASENIVHTALEHRLMHAETLAYLLHNLPHSSKSAPTSGPLPRGVPCSPRMIEIPEGRTTLGKDRGDGFGWDNEFEAHDVSIGRFVIDRYKVTNGDYLEFVLEGAPPPHFWTQRNGKWFYRGMFGNRPLPLSSPVYVTHQEATQYARWKRKKLPSEAQFHRAAYCTQSGEQQRYPWGDAEPSSSHGNFGFQFWDPVSVHSTPAGESAWGVSQLVGNGWEWTSTEFGPFTGFHSEPNYPGYSSNFFDGKHYVLKGASPRTAHCFLRRSFRNWFRADYPYVYATFRCVED